MLNSIFNIPNSSPVSILGFGVEGQDLCQYLIQKGVSNISIHDQKPASTINNYLQSLLLKHNLKIPLSSFRLSTGSEYLHHLEDSTLIFRSPGFDFYHPALQKAKSRGAIISSVTDLSLRLSPAPIIGVTGTNGKGTVSTLIHQILTASGRKSWLGGNIGIPTLSFINNIKPADCLILELSSFQLQDLSVSPHLAVVLNITSDHLDYHQTQEAYIQAKLNIVSHQTSSDLAVINADYHISKSFATATPASLFLFSLNSRQTPGVFWQDNRLFYSPDQYSPAKLILSASDVKIPGPHNLENISAACLAAIASGATPASCRQAVSKFNGLPHRLEIIGEYKDALWCDDSVSTTPHTAIAALKSFPDNPIILISGGYDKGADYSEFGKIIASADSNVKTLILLGKTASKIKSAALSAGYDGQIIKISSTSPTAAMSEIVSASASLIAPGDVVLLSPASASFDMFANYQDRGRQFQSTLKSFFLK